MQLDISISNYYRNDILIFIYIKIDIFYIVYRSITNENYFQTRIFLLHPLFPFAKLGIV